MNPVSSVSQDSERVNLRNSWVTRPAPRPTPLVGRSVGLGGYIFDMRGVSWLRKCGHAGPSRHLHLTPASYRIKISISISCIG